MKYAFSLSTNSYEYMCIYQYIIIYLSECILRAIASVPTSPSPAECKVKSARHPAPGKPCDTQVYHIYTHICVSPSIHLQGSTTDFPQLCVFLSHTYMCKPCDTQVYHINTHICVSPAIHSRDSTANFPQLCVCLSNTYMCKPCDTKERGLHTIFCLNS